MICLIFDDGYRSNATLAAPILANYGGAATIAIESERVSQDYMGDAALPVVTPSDMRTLASAGWEIANHPALNLLASEAAMAASARAENQLLVDLMTGARVYDSGTNTFVSSTVTNPEFATTNIVTAVYRGGARNDTSDLAYRSIFDRFRCIPGGTSNGENALYIDPKEQFLCALPIDTSAVPLDQTLAIVRGVIAAGSNLVMYAHDTPVAGPTGSVQPPYINADELDTLCRAVAEMGETIRPLRALGPANIIHDPRFAGNSTTLAAASGDTAEFATTDTLNGQPRCIRLEATAYRGNISSTACIIPLAMRPNTNYRIRIRYKIETDLARNGDYANHGLEVMLSTLAANAPKTWIGSERTYEIHAGELPYQSTGGYAEFETVLASNDGPLGTLTIGLFQCTGEVRIGHVSVEQA